MKKSEAETLPDILNALQLQAQEYRYRMRLHKDAQIEIEISHVWALRAIAGYGSLRAAADAVFLPGTVTLVNRTWRDTRDKINTLFQTGPKPFHVSDPVALFRIAVGFGSGKI
jgi:hypothetical protein